MAKSVQQSVSMDEALEETKYGKFNYFVICVSGLILINVILESLGISFVLPITKCDMDLSFEQKGILGAVGFLGIISSSHVWGFLADTTGRKKVMKPTLITGYLVTVVSSLSPNFLVLVILRYVNGVMLSGGSATIYAYLGEFHCDKLRNRAIMSAGFICAAVSCVYPIMAWAVINQTWSFYIPILGIVFRPWRMYILSCGLLGFICGLCFFRLPESPKYLLSMGREQEAIAVLKRIYSINTGNNMDDYKITSIKPDADKEKQLKMTEGNSNSTAMLVRSMWNQTAPLFMREHCRKTALICTIQFWIFFAAQGVYMWFPYLLNSVMEYTSKHSNVKYQICEIFYMMERPNTTTIDAVEQNCDQTLELSTFEHTLFLEFIYVAIFLCVGYFTGKLGRIPSLFLILLLNGVCGVLCAVINIPIVAVYFLVVFLVSGIGATVLNAITVDIFPTHLRAMALCISLMIGRIGSVVGTNVVGTLLEYHCQIALLLPSILLILSGLMAFVLPLVSKTRNQTDN